MHSQAVESILLKGDCWTVDCAPSLINQNAAEENVKSGHLCNFSGFVYFSCFRQQGEIEISLHQIKKSSLHYTRDITPKRSSSGGAHLRGLAPGQHSSEKMSRRCRAVASALTN